MGTKFGARMADMNKILTLLFVASIVVLTMASVGCDLGTYQQRANAPIPSNTVRAGDVGNSLPVSDDAPTEDEESE